MILVGIDVSSIAGAADAMRALYGYDLHDPDERTALAHALADIFLSGVRSR